ncbi:MAG: hypothetical protein JSW67_02565 [Candidatus Latescibacterota bacterium]|nr:MAG: hypothetical protein JSW67_02565 [Candidatus Latescibacterota bacterium]
MIAPVSKIRITCALLVALLLGSSYTIAPPLEAKEKQPYTRSPGAMHAALLEIAQHTMERDAPAQRLFVESYFMRSLIAAHEAVGDEVEPEVARAWLRRAVAFGDSLLLIQNDDGYLPIGYPAGYLADMAAALCVFPVLEAYVDSARLERYEGAVRRYLAAIERDGMLLSSGAVGTGWPELERRGGGRVWRSDMGWYDEPYLVSTALAGISLNAWLYHRSGRPEYKRRAMAALDFTLEQLEADGSFPSHARFEGKLRNAAYVQEGWMAADAHLGDSTLVDRLREPLGGHVAWLVGEQTRDGTWVGPVHGDFARTPAVINFLIWYDRRLGSDRRVQKSVRRACGPYQSASKREQYGLFAQGEDNEVLTAFSGRALAAIVAGRPMP